VIVAAEDYLNFDFVDYDEEIEVRCKRCGMHGLFWNETPYGWRLFDSDNSQHHCTESVRVKMRDFKKLD